MLHDDLSESVISSVSKLGQLTQKLPFAPRSWELEKRNTIWFICGVLSLLPASRNDNINRRALNKQVYLDNLKLDFEADKQTNL